MIEYSNLLVSGKLLLDTHRTIVLHAIGSGAGITLTEPRSRSALHLRTAVIVGLQGQTFEAAFTSGTAERLFAGVAGVGALVAIAITVGIAQLGERRRREAGERWNRQIARWQQSWYCHRCHVAFVAGSAQAVAPEQFGRLLATM